MAQKPVYITELLHLQNLEQDKTRTPLFKQVVLHRGKKEGSKDGSFF